MMDEEMSSYECHSLYPNTGAGWHFQTGYILGEDERGRGCEAGRGYGIPDSIQVFRRDDDFFMGCGRHEHEFNQIPACDYAEPFGLNGRGRGCGCDLAWTLVNHWDA